MVVAFDTPVGLRPRQRVTQGVARASLRLECRQLFVFSELFRANVEHWREQGSLELS